jgi:hypothetical protein
MPSRSGKSSWTVLIPCGVDWSRFSDNSEELDAYILMVVFLDFPKNINNKLLQYAGNFLPICAACPRRLGSSKLEILTKVKWKHHLVSFIHLFGYFATVCRVQGSCSVETVMNFELRGMQMQIDVAQFEVLPRNLPGRTEKNYTAVNL